MSRDCIFGRPWRCFPSIGGAAGAGGAKMAANPSPAAAAAMLMLMLGGVSHPTQEALSEALSDPGSPSSLRAQVRRERVAWWSEALRRGRGRRVMLARWRYEWLNRDLTLGVSNVDSWALPIPRSSICPQPHNQPFALARLLPCLNPTPPHAGYPCTCRYETVHFTSQACLLNVGMTGLSAPFSVAGGRRAWSPRRPDARRR